MSFHLIESQNLLQPYLDLALNENYAIELFSFPNPKPRLSMPEACGLRHIAFVVENIDKAVNELKRLSINTEDVRVDEFTGKRFTFFSDPDNLPIELYELSLDNESSS